MCRKQTQHVVVERLRYLSAIWVHFMCIYSFSWDIVGYHKMPWENIAHCGKPMLTVRQHGMGVNVGDNGDKEFFYVLPIDQNPLDHLALANRKKLHVVVGRNEKTHRSSYLQWVWY